LAAKKGRRKIQKAAVYAKTKVIRALANKPMSPLVPVINPSKKKY
jgi:hypothetical protein